MKVLVAENLSTKEECQKVVAKTSTNKIKSTYAEDEGWQLIYERNSPLELSEFHRKEAEKLAIVFKKSADDFFNETRELKAKIIQLEKERSQIINDNRPQLTPVADCDLLNIIKGINPKTKATLKDLRIIAEAINDGTIIPGEPTEMIRRYKREAEASSQTALDWNQRYEDLRNKTVEKKSGY